MTAPGVAMLPPDSTSVSVSRLLLPRATVTPVAPMPVLTLMTSAVSRWSPSAVMFTPPEPTQPCAPDRV